LPGSVALAYSITPPAYRKLPRLTGGGFLPEKGLRATRGMRVARFESGFGLPVVSDVRKNDYFKF
jgi:hypothetical protein